MSINYGNSFAEMSAELRSQGVTIVDLPVPEDPYDWRLLQFRALQALDYPVQTPVVSAEQAREAYELHVDPVAHVAGITDELRPLYEYKFNKYPRWRLPIARDADFAEWISGGILPDLEGVTPQPEEYDDLYNHPATVLPGAVDLGFVKIIKSYKDRIGHEGPIMAVGQPMPHFRRVLGESYLSAFDRLVDMIRLAPDIRLTPEGDIGRNEFKLRENYKGAGFEGVVPADLYNMTRDFYVMLGAAVPQFAQFRRLNK